MSIVRSLVRSFVRKTKGSRSLYLQILFVTLAFTLMVISSGMFVNYMLVNYLKRDAVNILLQTQIRIMDDLLEPETLMISIAMDVRDIIIHGGSAEDVQEYYDEISAELSKKEGGFIFDGLHGYFEALGNVYIPAPGWTVPDDYNATERPWYKGAVEAGGKITITPIYKSLRSDKYQINVACRIFDDSGEPLGVVTMNVLLDNITKFIADMHLVEGGYGFLANENFILVAHHEADFETEHMNEISSGFRKIVELMEQGASFVKVEGYNYQNINSIFYCERIENGWYLGIITPKNVYYKDLRVLITFLGALGIVLMLVVNFILIRIDAAKIKLDEKIREQRVQLEMQATRREMEKAIEEKNTLVNLWNILDGLDTMIYVADPDTDEILFINDNMKRHYGIEDDVTGQICYKIFQKNLNEKCVFCPCFQLDKEPDKVIVWEERSALKDCVYRNIDRYIDWPNGKKAHLQQSIDITDLSTMTDTLNKRLEQQSLMTYISQSFLSTEDIDVLITKVLRMVGEFMGFDQILMHVTQDDEISFICKNEYINPKLGLATRVGGTFKISKVVWDIIQRVKEHDLINVTSNDPEVKKAISPYRVNFNDYILTCIFLGDKLYAVIDFSREGYGHRWDQNEINMASYVTNVLVGALSKHSIELQLIAAKEAAEQSNRSKGIFLANMSHEIRTPMNAILGVSEIQLQNKTLPPAAEEAFEEIYDSGNLLLNIINDILDFSKIEAGKLEIVPVKYDIPSLLNDIVQLNRLRYESKQIEFKLNLYANTPYELYGDELRIKQILNNLLSNAFKYTSAGEIKLSVSAEKREDEETVTLIFRVSDTGQGMRKDQIDRLFDEYSRFNMETNRGVPGTGLGMSIVKRLVNMMNGDIFVASEAGKGSKFTVRLPQKNIGPAICGSEVAESLRNFSFRSIPISKKTQFVHEYMPYGSVLIVDDVASNLYVAKGLLTSYGLRIETAANGAEAIEKIKNGSVYDIVFMDHMMPVMNGIEAVKIIRGMGYTNPIVALTANAVVGQSDMFLANGFNGFIPKPIDSRELDAVLGRFIRDKQPREVIDATRREQQKKETENSARTDSARSSKNEKDMSELGKYFVADAEKAIKTMEEVYEKLHTPDSKVIDSYVTAAHGMKSALANIGETELSVIAFGLEKAGKERNLNVIAEETPAFIGALRFLIDKYKPADDVDADDAVEISANDTVYLRDKLLDIKAACGTFDITAAKNALDDLRQKTWPRHINEILDEISVHLLHSAFKKAASAADNAAKM